MPPIQWIMVSLSPEVKRPRREADHSLPFNAEVKNAWNYSSSPPYAFIARYVSKNRDTLPFIMLNGVITHINSFTGKKFCYFISSSPLLLDFSFKRSPTDHTKCCVFSKNNPWSAECYSLTRNFHALN